MAFRSRVNKINQSSDFQVFATDISFRFIKPHMSLPRGYHRFAKLLERIGISLEVINTRIPFDEQGMKYRLHEICKIPKMSTFAIGAMINRGVSLMHSDQVFVNIGVWCGFTFLSGMAGNMKKNV